MPVGKESLSPRLITTLKEGGNELIGQNQYTKKIMAQIDKEKRDLIARGEQFMRAVSSYFKNI